MPSTAQRQIIREWFAKSQQHMAGDEDHFARFIFLWIAFNSWYDGFRSKIALQKHKDASQIQERRFIDYLCTYQEFLDRYRELMNDHEFKQLVKVLKRKAPVNNLLRGVKVEFSDINSFEQYLNLIYQIRNNLFHGGKNLDAHRDLSLVTLAYQTLTRLFEPVVARLSHR